jgi:hypothetical protein
MQSPLTPIVAQDGGADWSSYLTGGGIAGLLGSLFLLFLRDSARNDRRADDTAARLVAAANAERDRARFDAEKQRRDSWLEKQQLYERIADLEARHFGEVRTFNVEPEPPEPTLPFPEATPVPELEGDPDE